MAINESSEFRRPNVKDDELKTVNDLLHFHIHHNPKHVFCVQAGLESDNETAKLTTITYENLLALVACCCQYLQLDTGKGELENNHERETPQRVALLMSSDVVILIHMFALLSRGIPTLLLSPRLSPEGVSALTSQLDVKRILVAKRFRPLVESAVKLRGSSGHRPSIENPTSLEDLVKGAKGEHHADGNRLITGDELSYREDNRDVLILHSSGTTGLPKPIPCSHSWLLNFLDCHELKSSESERPMLSTLPLYHGYGFVAPFVSMGSGKPFCLPSADVALTGDSVMALVKSSAAGALITVPSILEEIADAGERILSSLKSLEFVATGGGNLNSTIAESLSHAGVALLNHFGATECGPLAPIFVPDAEYDWRYFRLRKDIRFSLYISSSRMDAEGDCYQLTLFPPGWDSPFVLQDMLIQNPGTSRDFKVLGRADDLLVLASGEKIFPGPIEEMIMRSPLVARAVVFGSDRFEVGVLVQPTRESITHGAFSSLVWELITEVNQSIDGFARIASRNHILVVSPSSTFPLTDKGTLKRQEAYVQFRGEIDALYANLTKNPGTNGDTQSVDRLASTIKNSLQSSSGWLIPDEQWTVDDNLFELGADSLQILQLSRIIAKDTDRPPAEIRKLIAQHTSIRKLVTELSHPDQKTAAPSESDEVARYITTYCQFELPPAKLPGLIVLVTGGTGSLGCHLVGRLLQHPNVRKIICLNRPKRVTALTAIERQTQTLQNAGYIVGKDDALSKLQVYEVLGSEPNLGLSFEEYDALSLSVTHIIHAAWPMSFNQGIASYEPQFCTLQNLILLSGQIHSRTPSTRPRLIFISSIATVGRFPNKTQRNEIPEVTMVSERFTVGTGYANAKLVCEKMIEMTRSRDSDKLEVSFIRLGQIVGSSSSGKWNHSEHLPALIKASQRLKCLPALQGELSWLPVDIAASCLIDILLSKQDLPLVMHLENPRRLTLNVFSKAVSDILGFKDDAPKDYPKWIAQALSLTDSPLLGLEAFFTNDFQHMTSGLVRLDTRNCLILSQTLREYGSTGLESLAPSIAYWKSTSFLD